MKGLFKTLTERKMNLKNKLSTREENFCRHFCVLQNSKEAAYLAGYRVLPVLSGEKLLAREEIRREITRLSDLKNDFQQVRAGFRRLAFGSVSDAVRLIDGEKYREELERDTVRLFAFTVPTLSNDSTANICKAISTDDLRQLNEALKEKKNSIDAPQLFSEEKSEQTSNSQFRF